MDGFCLLAVVLGLTQARHSGKTLDSGGSSATPTARGLLPFIFPLRDAFEDGETRLLRVDVRNRLRDARHVW